MIIKLQTSIKFIFLIILFLQFNCITYAQNYWNQIIKLGYIYNTNSNGNVNVVNDLTINGTIYTNTLSDLSGNGISMLSSVGIGGANPYNQGLYISGTTTNKIYMNSVYSGYSKIYEIDANGVNYIKMSGGSNGGFSFYNDYTNFIMQINNNGWVGIGTSTYDPNHLLSVNGSIRVKEIKVESGWSDFVFNTNYRLWSLEAVEKYINENRHLPDMPSAQEVKENGVDLGDMSAKLTQKVEELTLYVIDLSKEVEKLKDENKSLKNEQELMKKNFKNLNK